MKVKTYKVKVPEKSDLPGSKDKKFTPRYFNKQLRKVRRGFRVV